MIKYAYFSDCDLLIALYVGDIQKESVISFIQYVFAHPVYSTIDKLLLDCREAHILFRRNDLKEIAVSRNIAEAGQSRKRTVFLVDTPVETALLSLLTELYNKEMKPTDFCYTYQKCIQTLALDFNAEELDRRIKAATILFKE